MQNSSPDLLHQIFNGPMIISIMIVAFLLIVIFLVIKALRIKNGNKDASYHPPKGHYLNKGIATWMPLGYAISIPIGILTRNIPVAVILGPLLGMALGAFLGSKHEKVHQQDMRTLSAEEFKLKKLSQILLTGLIILGLILYLITYVILK